VNRRRQIIWIASSLVALAGCKGEVGLSGDKPSLVESPQDESATQPSVETPVPEQTTTPVQTTEPEVVYEIPEFTSQQLVTYLREISQMLISRPPTPVEVVRVEQEGLAAIQPILREWTRDPAFAENARYMMETKLKASGQRDGIDFDLPGHIVHHVVANAAGQARECDTGAPYAAGVLATRAFLAGNASRFNLGRASRLMNVFACRIYPMEDTLQPFLPKETLIPMFQAEDIDEQTVEEAKDGFGNGTGCYSCHGQFGAHAQLFVKFDESGNYVADADGLQDPDGELGRSVNGLMTSHMIEPAAAATESTQVFGQQVGNLSEAAAVIAASPQFVSCQLGNLVHYTFGLSESVRVDPRMLNVIVETLAETTDDPTYADLVVAAFSEPRVILSAVGAEEASQ
jgi:hypothetical protein